MLSKTFSVAAVALAASTMVSAQTSTKCSPLKKTCPADPAFGKNKLSCDMSSKCDHFSALEGTTVDYNDKGVVFSIKTLEGAPTMETDKYIFFGRVDVDVKPAKGKGIVTSVVLESDDLDEIDWEWVGSDNGQAQSNYFSKGDDSTFTRGGFHKVSSVLDDYHTYSVEWTKEAVNWIIDGNTVRTLKASDVKDQFPQTPMRVKLGSWVAGNPKLPKGTVDWAGGLTDLSQAPFDAYYKNVKIVDYAGGDSATSKSVKEYSYSDNTGSWESIKVTNGDGSSDDTSSSSSSKTSSTKTESASSSSTDDATSTESTTGAGSSTTMSSVISTTSAPSTTEDSGAGSSSSTSAPADSPTATKAPDSGASRLAMGSALFAAIGMMAVQLL